MSSDNPFQAPSHTGRDPGGYDRDASAAAVSARTIELLNLTRPWVSLMSSLLWIGTALLVLGSIGLVIGVVTSGTPQLIVLLIVYLLLIFVYGALASSLRRYAKGIGALSASESVVDLEDALEAQKNFWRLVGILTLVTIVFYILMLVLMFAGIMMPFGNFGPGRP